LKLLENRKHYKKKRKKIMPTEYTMMMTNKARKTRVTPELWKYHNIKSRMTRHDSFEFKCRCCHDEEEKWMDEFNAKKHIHTKKHENFHTHYRKYVDMEEKYEKAQEKIRELEKELFEFKGVNRIKSFLAECEPADTIIIEEETQETRPSGTIITNIKRYEVGYSSFDEIYDAFCKWSCNSFNNDEFKDEIKNSMIEYQQEMYGIEFGEYERNGTYDDPRFDFTLKFETFRK
jgi:hypothetical protein